MPHEGRIAVLAFTLISSIVAYFAASLRANLRGMEPCRRWFAFLAGTIAASVVFTAWIGIYGLGAAEPGWQGSAFGLFAGLFWGGFFAFVNSWVLWMAFDSPIRDYDVEHKQMMNSDLFILISNALNRVRKFKPNPEFARTGKWSWAIFFAAVLLPALWAFAFCEMVWLTEGAPGTKPVMPIKR
jgi:hypothetical protein